MYCMNQRQSVMKPFLLLATITNNQSWSEWHLTNWGYTSCLPLMTMQLLILLTLALIETNGDNAWAENSPIVTTFSFLTLLGFLDVPLDWCHFTEKKLGMPLEQCLSLLTMATDQQSICCTSVIFGFTTHISNQSGHCQSERPFLWMIDPWF